MNLPDFLLGLGAGMLLAVASHQWMHRPRRKKWRHYGLALVAALALTGCSTPLFVQRLVPVASVAEVPVEHVTTKTVTDQATGKTEVTQVTNIVVQTVTNWTTNVVVELSETTTRALASVGAVNAAVNDIAPNPVSGVLSVGLGGVAAFLGWLARLKTRQVREKSDLLETVIAGVETANVPEVKKTIADLSKAWGTAPALASAVAAQTKT